MIELLNEITIYISGLYTLPWIFVGFIVTLLISRITNKEKIDNLMRKIGLILLYFFVPLLLFRIFLDRDFGAKELEFTAVACLTLFFMYLLSYMFSLKKANQLNLNEVARQRFIKTVITNQGRSAAFIGGALLVSPWFVEAAIFIALVGIALFAVIPYILAYMHKKESHVSEDIHALPWYLKLYPWYLSAFAIGAVGLHGIGGISMVDLGDFGIVLKFYTSLTVPAALYYVGSGIHPHDLKKGEIKKLLYSQGGKKNKDHWSWIRNIFFLTVIITPLILIIIFGVLLILDLIPRAWFAVIVINSFLPVTSTNMFLVPYGIDNKVTALSVTWTTVVCVPIVVILIYVFTIFFP